MTRAIETLHRQRAARSWRFCRVRAKSGGWRRRLKAAWVRSPMCSRFMAGWIARNRMPRSGRRLKDGARWCWQRPVAESSITIDGVRIVIDSGLVRQPVYEPSTGITRLETIRASRASADQRAGRAGRTEPGIAVRLWREEQTKALPAFATPQILASDLCRHGARLHRLGRQGPAGPALHRSAARPAIEEARVPA
jgi:hypothetical protein